MKIDLEMIVSDSLMQMIRDDSDTESPPVMATGAVLAVDMLHDDGLHYLHTFRPDGTSAWQAAGMADFIRANALRDGEEAE